MIKKYSFLFFLLLVLFFSSCENPSPFDPEVTLVLKNGEERGNLSNYFSLGIRESGTFILEINEDYKNKIIEIAIPEGIVGIGKNVFNDNTSLKKVTLPESLEIIDDKAFRNCRNITSINFPNNIKKIGAKAFYGALKINSLTLPKSLIYLGSEAFSRSYINGSLYINGNLKTISDYAFYSSVWSETKKNDSGVNETFTYGIQDVYIAEGVMEIKTSAFMDCKILKTVSLPSTLERIEDNVFSRDYAITSVNINQDSSSSPIKNNISSWMRSTDKTLEGSESVIKWQT